MRGVVIVLIVLLGAGFAALAVGTSKTVAVAKVEECVQRTDDIHKQVTVLGVSWIVSSIGLADGRTVSFRDREWSPDAFGNLCHVVYRPVAAPAVTKK